MRYAVLFFGQMLNYLLITTSIRAASQGKIWATGAMDVVISITSFMLIQRVATAHSVQEMAVYALGGAIGSMLAVRFTRRWNA